MFDHRLSLQAEPQRENQASEANLQLVIWSRLKRLIFRLAFCYLLLFSLNCASILVFFLTRTLGGTPSFPFANYVWNEPVLWIANRILSLDITAAPVVSDSKFSYVLVFFHLILALVATVLWSVLDRNRTEYRRLHAWFQLVLSFLLGGMMLSYGFSKLFPLQFGTVTPGMLATQFGEMSLMGVLWTFMAASPAYTALGGAVEVVGGTLLLFPRLRSLGALVTFGAMANVFALNLTYGVPVKLLSFHLLVISIILLAPDLPRLTALLVLNRPTFASEPVPLSQSRKVRRAIWTTYGLLALSVFLVFCFGDARRYGQRAAAPKPPFYGVWTVEGLTRTANETGYLFTEKARTALQLGPEDEEWSRLVFETPQRLSIVCPNGAVNMVTLDLDKSISLMSLTDKDWDPDWSAKLKIEVLGPELLNLSGTVNGVEITTRLRKIPEAKFRLTQERFRFTTD